jgi:hypothetical protein
MSSFVSEIAETLKSNTILARDDASHGQRHDRIQNSQQDTMASSGGKDISTTQRMVSATWGSILTTLLGKTWLPATSIYLVLTWTQ